MTYKYKAADDPKLFDHNLRGLTAAIKLAQEYAYTTPQHVLKINTEDDSDTQVVFTVPVQPPREVRTGRVKKG
jgi:hypothetical protein